MVFSSLLFIFVFLPLFIFAYYLTPRAYRNITALVGSYFFYSWGAPQVVLVLLGSSLADYLIAKRIDKANGVARYRWMAFAVLLNASLLVYYKYANFFVAEFSRILLCFGGSSVPWVEVVLPVGISFFTFQKLSYCVDVYRRDAEPAASFVDYCLYVVLFPQLIAGPIVRYHDVAQQLRYRRETPAMFALGVQRFCLGLGKKVLIADEMGAVADGVFALPASELSISYAWVGILAYTFQIYFDFAGYSDMAIGLGRLFGFEFLENFNRPYVSQSITEFWRRWHMSLSSWMREYLYIPLGGNRVGKVRLYVNLWIVFLLSGFWHGAQWNFLAWGAYHGLFLVLERAFLLNVYRLLPAFVRNLLTVIAVVFGWVLFRSADLGAAVDFSLRLLGLNSPPEILARITWGEIIGIRQIFVVAVAAVLSFTSDSIWQRLLALYREGSLAGNLFSFLVGLGALLLFCFSVLSLANSQFSPFLYFRF
ncbi:MAG: MBOAT family protein [bacterium]|nr:MBOAT family protein [bacterium]